VIWPGLYIVAALLLLLHWRGRNAVWGTGTLGLVIGVVVALVRDGFDWWIVAKITAIATLIGTIFEWLPRLVSHFGRSSDNLGK